MSILFPKLSADNSIAVIQQLLHQLAVPFTYKNTHDALKQHPDYPSIAAVHDVLKEYRVDSMVLQVDKEKLSDVPVSFIAYMNGKTRGFVTVVSISDAAVSSNTNQSLTKLETVNRQQFEQDWSGIVLLAEKNKLSGEKDFEANVKKEKLSQWRASLFTAGIVLLFILYAGAARAAIPLHLLLCLKLAGVIVTGLLLLYEIDRNNPFLQKV